MCVILAAFYLSVQVLGISPIQLASYFLELSDFKMESMGILWKKLELFPRTVFCDVPYTVHANKHVRFCSFSKLQTYVIINDVTLQIDTVQCKLPVNEFNEKATIIIWVYLFTLFGLYLLHSLSWTMTHILFPSKSESKVKRALKNAYCLEFPDSNDVWSLFKEQMIQKDTIFLLELISKKAGRNVHDKVVEYMFQSFLAKNVSD